MLLAALVAALTPYLVNLGGSTIWDANEAYYVETPREMLESGDYINPSFNYEPRFNKPVLSYWLVAGLYRVFGVSVATERVAIAGCAFVMLVAAFLLGRFLAGSIDTGLIAMLGLAAGPRFFMFSRRILIDMANSAALSMILVCFVLSELYPAKRRTFLIGMYVAVGLGMLIKGPVAVVLPVAAFLVYLAAHGELRRFREMHLTAGALIVLVIAAPWYVVLYLQHGWTYITQFFLVENVDRYLSSVGPNDARGPLFYLPVLVTDMFPWSFALVGVIGWWWRHRLFGRVVASASRDTTWRMVTLLLSWCAAFVVFFSFSRSKQDLYIFPIAPAVAALGGWFIHQMISQPAAWRRWFAGTFSALGVTLVVLGALVIVVFVKAGTAYPLGGAIAVGAVAMAGGGLVAVMAWRDARAGAVISGAATLVLINWLLALQILPAFERYKPIAPLSAIIDRRLRPGDIVAHFDLALPSMTYYLRRHVEVTSDRQALQAILRSGKRVFAVMPASRYDELRADFAPDTCVIGRHPTADVKLRNVLAGVAPPEVIVVLTPCPSS